MSIEINRKKYFLAMGVAKAVGVTRQILWHWRRNNNILVGSKHHGCQIVYTPTVVKNICQFAERIELIADQHRRDKTLFEG